VGRRRQQQQQQQQISKQTRKQTHTKAENTNWVSETRSCNDVHVVRGADRTRQRRGQTPTPETFTSQNACASNLHFSTHVLSAPQHGGDLLVFHTFGNRRCGLCVCPSYELWCNKHTGPYQTRYAHLWNSAHTHTCTHTYAHAHIRTRTRTRTSTLTELTQMGTDSLARCAAHI
jgi:hypothetical protein